jgi:hypothetical protein
LRCVPPIGVSEAYGKVICALVLVVFGLAMEAAQQIVGRQPSLWDALANASGVVAGAFIHQGQGLVSWPRASAAAAGAGLLAISMYFPALELIDAIQQRWEVPRLGSFERAAELRRWSESSCGLAVVNEHATHGKRALRVDLLPGQFPGISLEPPPDWSAYKLLQFNVYLSGSSPLGVVVKIFDRKHDGEFDDRFNYSVRLQPGSNSIRLSLQEVATAPRLRRLDLKQIEGFSLFTVDLRDERTFYLDDVRLE